MKVVDFLMKVGLLDKAVDRPYVIIRCPFHEDTHPSLSVILQDGYKARPAGFAKCFGCGKVIRNVNHFAQELLKLKAFSEFKEYLRALIKPVKEKEVPIYNPAGELVYYQEIWFDPSKGGKTARYVRIKNGKRVYGLRKSDKLYPYGLNTIQEGVDNFVLVESVQDAEALRSIAEGQAVLATCGANNWQSHWDKDVLEYLKNKGIKKVCIIPQADKAGREWAIKVYGKCKGMGLETYVSFVCEREGVKDLADLIENIQEDSREKIKAVIETKIRKYMESEIPIAWYLAPHDYDKLTITDVSSGGFVISYRDKDRSLFIDVQVKQSSEGIKGHVLVESNLDYSGKMLSYVTNFSKPSTFEKFQKALAKDLGYSKNGFSANLGELIRQEVFRFLKKARYIDLKEVVCGSPSWLIEPLIYEKAPTLLYAPKAMGKTTLACFIAMAVENNLKYPYLLKQGRVLYLDWENFEDVIKYKMQSVVKACDETKSDEVRYPYYLKCVYPLVSIASEVKRIIVNEGIKLIIIDSLIPSLGGLNSNDATSAGNYFGAIREWNYLGCSVLVLNHVAKRDADSQEYTWLGSVMFGNLARIVWQVNAQSLEDELYLTLQCKYNNYGKLPSPFDVVFGFDGDGLNKIKIKRNTDNLYALSLPERIKIVLRSGSKTKEEIGREIFSSSEEYERRKGSLSVTLTRLKEKGVLIKVKDKWALVTKRDEEVPF